MDLSVSPKDEICFLLVCHHISYAVYVSTPTDCSLQAATALCDVLGSAFSVSRLGAEEKKPLQLYLSLFALAFCNRTVIVNTAPLSSLQDCITFSCMFLLCYFRHILVFVGQSSGKLTICNMCRDCCLDICIVRSLEV